MPSNVYESNDSHSGRVILLAFFIMIIVVAIFSTVLFIKEVPAFSDARSIIVENKINPNTASLHNLTRLPNIGITRASAIISYRENSVSSNPFTNVKDLENVEGIGQIIAQQLDEYLIFD